MSLDGAIHHKFWNEPPDPPISKIVHSFDILHKVRDFFLLLRSNELDLPKIDRLKTYKGLLTLLPDTT